jgi:hypothetical protein
MQWMDVVVVSACRGVKLSLPSHTQPALRLRSETERPDGWAAASLRVPGSIRACHGARGHLGEGGAGEPLRKPEGRRRRGAGAGRVKDKGWQRVCVWSVHLSAAGVEAVLYSSVVKYFHPLSPYGQ